MRTRSTEPNYFTLYCLRYLTLQTIMKPYFTHRTVETVYSATLYGVTALYVIVPDRIPERTEIEEWIVPKKHELRILFNTH